MKRKNISAAGLVLNAHKWSRRFCILILENIIIIIIMNIGLSDEIVGFEKYTQ